MVEPILTDLQIDIIVGDWMCYGNMAADKIGIPSIVLLPMPTDVLKIGGLNFLWPENLSKVFGWMFSQVTIKNFILT